MYGIEKKNAFTLEPGDAIHIVFKGMTVYDDFKKLHSSFLCHDFSNSELSAFKRQLIKTPELNGLVIRKEGYEYIRVGFCPFGPCFRPAIMSIDIRDIDEGYIEIVKLVPEVNSDECV